MKILKFKKLTLTNFLSVGNTPLELKFQDGLNLITGYNKDFPEEKNGIGKSSICDGLFFALFNETIKDIKMGEIVNDKNVKGCVVELDFEIEDNGKSVDYTVKRSLKPSNCEFIVDGVSDETLSSIPKTNAAIVRILGVSKDLFKQVIIMSIGKSVSFFAQGKAEKRKFIEGVVDLELISEMLSDSRKGYNDTKRDKEQLHIQLENEENRLSQYEEKEKSFEDNKKEFISLLTTQIATDTVKIAELKKTFKPEKESSELQTSLNEIDGTLKNVEDLNLTVEIKLSTIRKEVSSLQYDINNSSNICDKCNRPFDDIDDRNAMKLQCKEKIETLDKERIDFINKKGIISAKKKIFVDKKDAIKMEMLSARGIVDNNKTIQSHILSLNTSCKQNNERVDGKREEVSAFCELISKSKEDIVDVNSEYKEAFKNNKVFDICKFVLSEEGVKSVIVDNLKKVLNFKMNEYLDSLGSQVTCEFDEYFSESIYNKNGKEKSYDAFSGGEQRRIDLAILLTFQDILKDQSGLDIRLGFYDEILDSSIDEGGRIKVLQILKNKSKHTPIYIISHRGKMSGLIDNEIVLEKHNDFTYLKETI